MQVKQHQAKYVITLSSCPSPLLKWVCLLAAHNIYAQLYTRLYFGVTCVQVAVQLLLLCIVEK